MEEMKETFLLLKGGSIILSSYRYHNLHAVYYNIAYNRTYVNRYMKMIVSSWLQAN